MSPNTYTYNCALVADVLTRISVSKDRSVCGFLVTSL